MNDPLGHGNCVEWSDHIYHRAHFDQKQTVEEVHAKMLGLGIDYAAEIDEENIPIGLISFKRLSAALSARYGQALFAKKMIGEAFVPSAVLGYMNHIPRDHQTSIVIPISQATVFNPVLDFFTAQACLGRRAPDHTFDDIIVTSDDGTYEGMISMPDFMKLQMSVLHWQQCELRQHNETMNRTLSQLSQAQAELVNSAKMAALGELVAGIAHEMNTPLGVLISSHDMIQKIFDLLTPDITPERRAQLSHHLRTNIDLGREASERVTQIIRSLRTFGRDDREEQHAASLIDLIESTLVLLANKFKSSIVVHTDLAEGAQVLCYPGQISQVLVNVLTNAFQAMQGGGDIYIDLQRGMDHWELTIRDTGPGIPVHLIDRIFDPGFTTKGVGIGTGLGLSISKKIIEQNHGGRIVASNHPLGGAVFLMELPMAPRESGDRYSPAGVPGFSSKTS
jgi:signal transduction histidine kinase